MALPTEIKDDKDNWFRSFFSKNYYAQGFVYFEEGKPAYCGDTIMWLDKVFVRTTSQKRADKLMFEYFHKEHPRYVPYVQLF